MLFSLEGRPLVCPTCRWGSGAAKRPSARSSLTMLALAEADPLQDLEMITCIISRPTGRVTVTLPADTTLSQLHQAVATQANVVPGTFELRRQALGPLNDAPPLRLADADADTVRLFEASLGGKHTGTHSSKVYLELAGIDGGFPVHMPASDSGVAASALGMVTTWSQQRGAEQLPQVAKSVGHSSDAEPNAAPTNIGAPKNAEGFVGLINQGATCYLSSLLQVTLMHYSTSPPCCRASTRT